MATKRIFLFDETKFRPGQQKAALLLTERDFLSKDERKSLEEIAQECGVTRVTLWNWTTKDSNFIAYKNYLASEMMDSQLSFVYSKLMDIIGEGNAKGIEMFLKRIGDLDTRTDVTVNDNRQESDQSFEERRAELMKRLGLAEAAKQAKQDADNGVYSEDLETDEPKRPKTKDS